MVIEAGQTVGSVVLREKIADGGMGTVWAAEQVGLGRHVAVKFLATRIVGNPEATKRFTLEARLLARIQSPHTPQVFDYGVSSDGTPYIVMELIEGTELKEWVPARGNMSVAQVGRLVRQVALALTAAHELGIVHRDVKPENIILSGGNDDFHAKLIDFGIAKSRLARGGAITHVGVTVGTPSYMSPEQILGSSNLDGRTDVWSLAIVAYWCLTGTVPFEASTPGAAYLAIHEGTLTPITEVRPDVPEWLVGWFEKGLARNPEERFESAAVMSETFDAGGSAAVTSTTTGTTLPEENEPIPLVRMTPTLGVLAADARQMPKRRRAYTPFLAVTAAAIAVALGFATHGGQETATLGHDAIQRERETKTTVTHWVSALTARMPPLDQAHVAHQPVH